MSGRSFSDRAGNVLSLVAASVVLAVAAARAQPAKSWDRWQRSGTGGGHGRV